MASDVRRTLAGLLVVATLTGCASAPKASGTPSVNEALEDKHTIYARFGNQLPVVVLQAGLGNDKTIWRKVIPGLARDHSVIAFDRPGHAGNPSTDASRDPCTIAAEQRALLQSAGVPPPYLLVGHSMGGLYQYVYAKLYPSDVAGIVLLDPTHPRHWETMQREAPSAAVLMKVLRVVAFSSIDRSEFDSQTACLDRLDLSRPLTVPNKVLVSGRFRPEERGDFEVMLKRLRQDWLPLTGAPRLDLVLDSRHFIQLDNPEAVVAAVQQVTAEIPGDSRAQRVNGTQLEQAMVASSDGNFIALYTGGNSEQPEPAIVVGKTTKAEVRESLGLAGETVSDPESGDEVWTYSSKTPFFISFIPVIGDIADVIEMFQKEREWVVLFDKQGVVKKYELRELDY
jgi:pimeloyl-ACP methyl ester carboxylesterase